MLESDRGSETKRNFQEFIRDGVSSHQSFSVGVRGIYVSRLAKFEAVNEESGTMLIVRHGRTSGIISHGLKKIRSFVGKIDENFEERFLMKKGANPSLIQNSPLV